VTATYQLTDRTAVVTGGARGIGRAVAERLRDSGSLVWVLDVAPVELEGISVLAVDVTDSQQVARALARVVERSSRIEVLVNSAGMLGGYQPFEGLTRDAWHRILDVNLVAVFEVCRQVLPHMRKAASGRIVNLGSLAGKHGLANMSVYSAASAGVIAFTKALGQELAGTQIRVNCVAPAPIATDLILSLGPDVVGSMIQSSPMKRLGLAEEVAEITAWLCSDECSFTTGAVFDVSGGRAAY